MRVPCVCFGLFGKNRNKFTFERRENLTVDIGYKVHDEVSVWFVAQQLDRQGEKREACMEKEQMRSWKKKIPL